MPGAAPDGVPGFSRGGEVLSGISVGTTRSSRSGVAGQLLAAVVRALRRGVPLSHQRIPGGHHLGGLCGGGHRFHAVLLTGGVVARVENLPVEGAG